MQNENILQLEVFCTQIRNAILNIREKTNLLKRFPLGCCRDASLILGQFLTEKGYKDIYYCRKDIDAQYASHAWLEYNDHIIDITADQFENIFPPILIVSNRHTSAFHRWISKEPFNFYITGLDTINLSCDYNLIKIEVERPSR